MTKKMTKAYEIEISGSYRTATGDIVDFENVKGIVPFCEEDVAKMHVRSRYAPMWVREAKDKDGEKAYKSRIQEMRQVFIDDIEEIETEQFSYVGKDVRDLDSTELQDLATARDLRRIPLPKEMSGMSIREMRQIAYVEYARTEKGIKVDTDEEGFVFKKLPELVVDGFFIPKKTVKKTAEELAEQSLKAQVKDEELYAPNEEDEGADDEGSALNLSDLKEIADSKEISYHPSIGFDALHKKIYG